ncbi:keratin-associated protein 5-1-like [Panicum virgatum]|uniref:Uncharacterized protein n=1 Tax=Panicum virgatum TaxID=38727 RepID=A0A8T0XBJ5_PANVG|nr:keratin-associated protein 5-1-like [Panicum virgatum]KAG2656785.1 hypothetical protein PVAP13_1KG104800 [Panicum virgatum]
MASSGVVAAGVAGGDVVFCVAIACLSLLSMIIFAAAGSSAGGGGGKRGRAGGPVFVSGKGCGCGACRAGAGVCGTYLA